jgi:hypothetical protein
MDTTSLVDSEISPMASNCEHEFIPIVYGFPTSELMIKSDRGEVVLGGCTIDSDRPLKWCGKCLTAYPEYQPEGYLEDE